MNKESELVFIVGPGGAGKSTTGKLLAERLKYDFVDVDLEFCDRIVLIPDYLRDFGYKAYCEANSELVDQLLTEHQARTVMTMPSGFLVHEDSPELVHKHTQLLGNRGVTFMLLPSRSLEQTVDIIVRRQLSRGFNMNEASERAKIQKRHGLYMKHGDLQIFSHQPPEKIADLMFQELNKLGLPKK